MERNAWALRDSGWPLAWNLQLMGEKKEGAQPHWGQHLGLARCGAGIALSRGDNAVLDPLFQKCPADAYFPAHIS